MVNCEGWTCPTCRRNYAPWMPSCNCINSAVGVNTTSITITPHADDTAELVEAAERHLRALNEVRQRDYSHKLAGTVAEKEAAWDALSHAKREAAEARKGLEAALARVKGER